MKRTLFFLILSLIVMQSGCHLIPGFHSNNDGLKRNIFGVHGKNDPNFGEKVAKDPFPSAESAGIAQKSE